ncbi:hypothetical protein CYMTET_16326, partial [Cymbomonas tetramitiformis]
MSSILIAGSNKTCNCKHVSPRLSLSLQRTAALASSAGSSPHAYSSSHDLASKFSPPRRIDTRINNEKYGDCFTRSQFSLSQGCRLKSGPLRVPKALPRVSSGRSQQRVSASQEQSPTIRDQVINVCDTFTNIFPVWLIVGGGIALWHPPAVTWFQGQAVTNALAVTMLGMGLTLNTDDFKSAVQMPRAVLAGVLLQYAVMPVLAYSIAKLLSLPSPLAVGLILVGCCPGGTASNLITYIAKAHVVMFRPLLHRSLGGRQGHQAALG